MTLAPPAPRHNGTETPTAFAALMVVDDLLNDRNVHATEILTSRARVADLDSYLRQVINLLSATVGNRPGVVWYPVNAPSPSTAELVTRYLSGDDNVARCDMCAPAFTGCLAQTTASLVREIHGPAALAAWRSLRDGLTPSPF